MWTITSTLLLTYCLWAPLVQSQDHDDIQPGYRRNVWENMNDFLTKGTKDKCSTSVIGRGDLTKLRITCHGTERSYWCEYQGKPHVCRSYNKNPSHYFKQIMWDLRKLPNACQGKRILKPQMCKRASDEAKMVFTSASFSNTKPMDMPYSTITTPIPTTPQPTTPVPVSEAKKLAQDYCWNNLQGVCSFFIGWFRN
ncbi:fibroblast growth factor binding protein 2a [Carassius auratus]|uniref:Fibroblast growth factor binding protein 2a n=1 Tax=Carassius auratus TaxID=7957 RepID=A0A6P6NUS8_CARAU|nr:fibroblast growth factor-binding protein 2-like [Carassius auratus]